MSGLYLYGTNKRTLLPVVCTLFTSDTRRNPNVVIKTTTAITYYGWQFPTIKLFKRWRVPSPSRFVTSCSLVISNCTMGDSQKNFSRRVKAVSALGKSKVKSGVMEEPGGYSISNGMSVEAR